MQLVTCKFYCLYIWMLNIELEALQGWDLDEDDILNNSIEYENCP